MEKAFWDGVVDSMKGDKPDYSRILGLVKEVRDELCDLAPQSWREEITNSIDLDILSQVSFPNSFVLDSFLILFFRFKFIIIIFLFVLFCLFL